MLRTVSIFGIRRSGERGDADKLKPYINGDADIVDAKLFNSSASKEELKEWAERIDSESV